MVFGRSKSSSSTASPAAASSAAAAACSDLRAAYHECFNRWYAEKFAKGQWHKDDCVGEWHKYRACLEVLDTCYDPVSFGSSAVEIDDARLVALVVVGYLLMLVLLFYGLALHVTKKRD
ncbi:hypothetical protein E2562_020401 [Oryza meyeriana var. granulata]|uniref:Uncharacterized protein n=1 Tax=Oryza meyeriana var. granulata TaxID=110450 RepID=A0A6G1DKU4_9ORYZ|nr:hypothetical protein E2562_020401 [Oryza meyeriana var. granulata]